MRKIFFSLFFAITIVFGGLVFIADGVSAKEFIGDCNASPAEGEKNVFFGLSTSDDWSQNQSFGVLCLQDDEGSLSATFQDMLPIFGNLGLSMDGAQEIGTGEAFNIEGQCSKGTGQKWDGWVEKPADHFFHYKVSDDFLCKGETAGGKAVTKTVPIRYTLHIPTANVLGTADDVLYIYYLDSKPTDIPDPSASTEVTSNDVPCDTVPASGKKIVQFDFSKNQSWGDKEGEVCFQVGESENFISYSDLGGLLKAIGMNDSAIPTYAEKKSNTEGQCPGGIWNKQTNDKKSKDMQYVFLTEDVLSCPDGTEPSPDGAGSVPKFTDKTVPIRFRTEIPTGLHAGGNLYLYFLESQSYTEPPGKCICRKSVDGGAAGDPEVIDAFVKKSECYNQTIYNPEDTSEQWELQECKWELDPEEDGGSDSAGGSEGSSSGIKKKDKDFGPTVADIEAQYGAPDGYEGPLPDCAFKGTCRDVNKLLHIFIRFGEMTLGIIGTFAFVFFIYGGMMMILSMGNAEKVKQGRDILVSAVIGIVIAVSAYIFVEFMLDALNVSEEFRGIGQ